MGEVRETITLVNLKDYNFASGGYIKETEIRQLTVSALVDTGAMQIVISEDMCARLGLGVVEERMATLAGNVKIPCKATDPVLIRWKDRYMTAHPLMLPGKEEVLLGVLPLEGMDLKVNPVDGCLEGAHGAEWVHYVRAFQFLKA